MEDCKTYTGDNLKEALLQVKMDLGEGAKIADTREVEENGFLGFFSESLVEVDAWLPEEEKQLGNIGENKSPSRSQNSRKKQGTNRDNGDQEWVVSEENKPQFSPRDQATRLIEQKGNNSSDETYSRDLNSSPGEQESPPRKTSSTTAKKSAREKDRKTEREIAGLVEKTDLLQEKIDQLTEKLDSDQQSESHETPQYPGRLSDLYSKLAGQKVKKDLARELIGRVRRMAEPDELDRLPVLEDHAREIIKEDVMTPASLDLNDPPLILPFIGPTGVGKTTTLAKLAAQKIFENKTVGFISLDIYRLAAVDQLRCYANILEVPMVDVENYDQFGDAVAELEQQGAELIFVDTAGHSQFDEEKISHLESVFASEHEFVRHLILPASLPEGELDTVLDGFGQVGYERLIVTKLDETRNFGTIYNLLHEVDEPVSHFTNGQDVPHDLRLAEADYVADLLLGGDE